MRRSVDELFVRSSTLRIRRVLLLSYSINSVSTSVSASVTIGGGVDLDIAEQIGLGGDDHAALDQFEHGQEGDDQFQAVVGRLQQRAEGGLADAADATRGWRRFSRGW